MKRYVALAIFLIAIVSCDWMNSDEVRYTQEQLNGTWQSEENNSLGCIQQLEIKDTVLSEIKICAGIPAKFKAKRYSFDGKILKYELYGIYFEYQIKALTDERLLLGYHDPVEYFRISK